jgi:hypothetical protein
MPKIKTKPAPDRAVIGAAPGYGLPTIDPDFIGAGPRLVFAMALHLYPVHH